METTVPVTSHIGIDLLEQISVKINDASEGLKDTFYNLFRSYQQLALICGALREEQSQAVRYLGQDSGSDELVHVSFDVDEFEKRFTQASEEFRNLETSFKGLFERAGDASLLIQDLIAPVMMSLSCADNEGRSYMEYRSERSQIDLANSD